MEETPRRIEESPEDAERENALLDVLEAAFERGVKVELSVSEPSGELRTSEVFVEGSEKYVDEEGRERIKLYVSLSKKSAVEGIPIGCIKTVKLAEENKE